jgi:hypothetical protein
MNSYLHIDFHVFLRPLPRLTRAPEPYPVTFVEYDMKIQKIRATTFLLMEKANDGKHWKPQKLRDHKERESKTNRTNENIWRRDPEARRARRYA